VPWKDEDAKKLRSYVSGFSIERRRINGRNSPISETMALVYFYSSEITKAQKPWPPLFNKFST
jgi:hypothetical protein